MEKDMMWVPWWRVLVLRDGPEEYCFECRTCGETYGYSTRANEDACPSCGVTYVEVEVEVYE